MGRYERKIFRLTQNITQNREDAEDAMQEAFLKAYEHLQNFEGNSRFYTWLVRIAVNQALMKLRKRRPNVVSLDEEVDTGEDMVPREVEDWGPSPADRYAQTELVGILAKVIGDLDPSFRIVFQLRDIEELSTEETAEALGLSVPAVKSRLVARAVEIAPNAQSILSAGRTSVKCKTIITELADYLDEALDPMLRARLKSISASARTAASSWTPASRPSRSSATPSPRRSPKRLA